MAEITRRDLLVLGAAAAGIVATGCDPSEDSGQVGGVVEDGAAVVIPTQTIPVLTEADVVVLGGGPSGLTAAIAAARAGADTVLVERYGSFGGVITQTVMGSIAWYRFAQTVDAGGIRLEIEETAKAMGASLDIFRMLTNETLQEYLAEQGLFKDGEPTYEILETEMFKHVADTMIQEAGVRPILHCWAVDAIMDGDVCRGVITESKSGRTAILAKRIIDCTGDADVAAKAGAPFRKSAREELMECTSNFGVSGVDLNKLMLDLMLKAGTIDDWAETSGKEANLMTPVIIEPFKKAQEAGEIPEDMDVICYPGSYTELGEIPNLNAVHLHNVDPTDVMDLTAAEIEGRKRVLLVHEALKKYQPGFEDARIRTVGQALGTRESRKILGEYDITLQDVKFEARFEDSVGICPEFIDGYGMMILPTTGRYFHVPYGIMVPKKVENLLVAGRCVAGDRLSHAATRQMVCCTVTGEAAGAAAALSIEDDVTPRDVEVPKFQAYLKDQNVRIS